MNLAETSQPVYAPPVWTPDLCMRATGHEPIDHASWLNRNPQLKEALIAARDCEQHIAEEQSRLYTLLAQAKNEIEVAAREYQIWYVEVYLQRASRLARERLEYFEKLDSEEAIQAELERCATDQLHWFKYYGWGYDPRARTPLAIVPFELYPRQEELVLWLDDIVFNKRASGIIEKSRDEGATEIGVRWGIHNWRFREGFSMLLSSRTEDEVDTKKKRGTLFERARFQLRLLPDWMLPKKFDIEKDLLPDKLISNPANGNALVGQAPVENMGRGDRVTCALFDEFAFWRFAGYPQHRSMSQTTDSIIMPSSVAGKLNQYADIAFDGVTEKFIMDWRENPFKDERWYNSLLYGYISVKMSATTRAQEVDRNYDASQPGKVWKYSEPHIFITVSEFLRPFVEAGQGPRFFNGSDFRPPLDWGYTRTHDYGQSDGHEWGYLLGGRPTENYILNDTHFIFLAQHLPPTGLTTEEAVAQWRRLETEIGVRDRTGKWIASKPTNWHSHEQLELRQVLLDTYGENWNAWDTDYQTGIETIQDWWTIIDKDKPNPFRPEIKGRCQLVFVAPDGEYQLAFNEREARHFVTASAIEGDSDRGFYQLRREISAYHYPENVIGKAVKDMRPVKELDNVVDPLRGYAVNWFRKPKSMTDQQKREAALPEDLRHPEKLIAQGDVAKAERVMVGRQMAFAEMDRKDRGARQMASRYRPQVPRVGLRRVR